MLTFIEKIDNFKTIVIITIHAATLQTVPTHIIIYEPKLYSFYYSTNCLLSVGYLLKCECVLIRLHMIVWRWVFFSRVRNRCAKYIVKYHETVL